MTPLNLIDIETPWGYRTFELHQGDITKLDFKVDTLVVSAFKNNYEPLPGTVVAALKDCGINLKKLAGHREFDLRKAFGCWTAKLPSEAKFERILCAEMKGGKFPIHVVIENIFAVLSMLEMKGIQPAVLALPILGTGKQQLKPAEVIDAMLTSSQKYMRQSASIEKIVFVAFSEDLAKNLNEAMDKALDRVKVVVPKGQWYDHARKSILTNIDRAGRLAFKGNTSLFVDARRVFSTDEVRSFEMGIVSRRLAEFIVADLLKHRIGNDLCGRIEALRGKNIAEWLMSYLHLLRIFGNESAHEKNLTQRRPPAISEADMGLCLLCLQQVLVLWIELRKAEANQKN